MSRIDEIRKALEDPTTRRRTYIYGDDAYYLIAKIERYEKALRFIEVQSEFHLKCMSKELSNIAKEALKED